MERTPATTSPQTEPAQAAAYPLKSLKRAPANFPHRQFQILPLPWRHTLPRQNFRPKPSLTETRKLKGQISDTSFCSEDPVQAVFARDVPILPIIPPQAVAARKLRSDW
jgi:hypothetical protein